MYQIDQIGGVSLGPLGRGGLNLFDFGIHCPALIGPPTGGGPKANWVIAFWRWYEAREDASAAENTGC
jgi:hypothetical protein